MAEGQIDQLGGTVSPDNKVIKLEDARNMLLKRANPAETTGKPARVAV